MNDADMDILAAEFVTGLAEASDAERAEALLASDPAFRSKVAFWRDRLGELDATAPAVPPSDALWARISNAARDMPRRAPAAAARPGMMQGLWDRVAFWRVAAFAATAAALLLAAGLGREIAERVPRVELVAVLETGDNRPAAVVNVYADGTALLVPLRAFDVPSGRVIQVWTLQSREQGPVSVGLMSEARTLRLDLNRLGRPDAGHLFEMTLEPAGGSPRPTGPILTKGLASRSL
jgi:anti-sigma-K factor RskA